MTTDIRTQSRHAPFQARRRSLLARLLAADARHRQSVKLRRLTAEDRRDMGLPPEDDGLEGARANLRFLTNSW